MSLASETGLDHASHQPPNGETMRRKLFFLHHQDLDDHCHQNHQHHHNLYNTNIINVITRMFQQTITITTTITISISITITSTPPPLHVMVFQINLTFIIKSVAQPTRHWLEIPQASPTIDFSSHYYLLLQPSSSSSSSAS